MLGVTEQRLQLHGTDAEMTLVSKPNFFLLPEMAALLQIFSIIFCVVL